MCVFLISPVPIAEPLTSELIDTPVFHNLAPRPIKYRVSVPIPSGDKCQNERTGLCQQISRTTAPGLFSGKRGIDECTVHNEGSICSA